MQCTCVLHGKFVGKAETLKFVRTGVDAFEESNCFTVEDFIIGELVHGHMLVKLLSCKILRLAFLTNISAYAAVV